MRISFTNLKALTFAEILVAFVAIGVLCALTVPVVAGTYKEKSTVIKLKKFHEEINEAFILAQKQYGPLDSWDWGTKGNGKDAQEILNVVAPYIKYEKHCGSGAKTGCIYNGNYWNINHTRLWGNAETSTNRSKMKLQDGSYLWLYTYGNSFGNKMCGQDVGKNRDLSSVCGAIAYDINGKKGPNLFGIDLFQFYISKYGIIPYGFPGETTGYENLSKFCNLNKSKTENTNGYSCTAWVIDKGNMDYLKEPVEWQ